MKKYIAAWIDETQFGYKCDTCKNEHRHGCGKDPFRNRIERRSCHCLNYNKDVLIEITVDTLRNLNQRNMNKYLKHIENSKNI